MRILYPGISSNLFVIELRHGKDNTLIISIFPALQMFFILSSSKTIVKRRS